jgi:hypothetical protein
MILKEAAEVKERKKKLEEERAKKQAEEALQ